MIDYLGKKEANLLTICDDSNTTNDTRGRLFEYIGCQRGKNFPPVDLGCLVEETHRMSISVYQQRFEFEEYLTSLGKAMSIFNLSTI